MSDKKVDKNCIICHTELSVGDAVYAVNVNLTDDTMGDWDEEKLKDRFRLIFKNSRKPKGAMHRECWDVHFGKPSDENKKQTPTMNANRLDSID